MFVVLYVLYEDIDGGELHPVGDRHSGVIEGISSSTVIASNLHLVLDRCITQSECVVPGVVPQLV